jgi:manganese efflux pump family protein
VSTFIQLIIISISLAMDSLSVSIAGGATSQKANIKQALRIASFFGIFQAGMPLIGMLIGQLLITFIANIDHWIAFALLSILGIKMIKESLEKTNEKTNNLLQTKTLILLSIATSIDALVVGITLSLLQISLLISISLIGMVTFVLCFFGFLFGKQLGAYFGKRIEILGGVALIAIGIKILLEHLS